MAYTFEELAKWWPGKSYPLAFARLVITQEDGRTSYADGVISSYNSTANEFSGTFAQQFSDRARQLMYGPPAVAAGPYAQNFDKNAGLDPAGVVFRKLGANRFELRLTLLRWGNALVTVSLTKAPLAKLYTGWGSTIGAGTGQALYVVSFNDAQETPG